MYVHCSVHIVATFCISTQFFDDIANHQFFRHCGFGAILCNDSCSNSTSIYKWHITLFTTTINFPASVAQHLLCLSAAHMNAHSAFVRSDNEASHSHSPFVNDAMNVLCLICLNALILFSVSMPQINCKPISY